MSAYASAAIVVACSLFRGGASAAIGYVLASMLCGVGAVAMLFVVVCSFVEVLLLLVFVVDVGRMLLCSPVSCFFFAALLGCGQLGTCGSLGFGCLVVGDSVVGSHNDVFTFSVDLLCCHVVVVLFSTAEFGLLDSFGLE